MEKNKKRIEILDELRGFAILAMIVHHFFLDVGDVLSLEWGYDIFKKLCAFQPIFWTIFIIISGICSRLSRNALKRGLIVFASGMVITFVTVVIMPHLGYENAQIYFGILHCLGASMIITGLLMPLIEKFNTLAGIIICAVLFIATYNINSGELLFGLIKLPDVKTNILMPLGLFNSHFKSADYFSILPWIFLFLIGAFIGKYAKSGDFPQVCYKRHSKVLSFVGRNSLWFYLGHQVVLYALLNLVLLALRIYVKIKMM